MPHNEPLAPVHPGEILAEEFLAPFKLSPYRAAALMKVPRTRIERLVAGAAPITVDTAIRLSRLFGTTPNFWLNLQTRFDVETIIATGAPEDVLAIEPFVANNGAQALAF